MQVNIKKLRPDVVTPSYSTDGSGAFDIRFSPVSELHSRVIRPHMAATFETGLAFEIPPGYGLFLLSRSGMGFKDSIRLCNSVGLLDSDYRGELLIRLQNDSIDSYAVQPGDKIAQGVVLPLEKVLFNVVDELSSTERGTGGFGSTGT